MTSDFPARKLIDSTVAHDSGAGKAENVRLCDYCAKVNFEFLRSPTVGELRAANSGRDVDCWPFRSFDTLQPLRHRDLGKQDRIDASAATCELCSVITDIMDKADIRARRPDRFGSGKNPDVHLMPCIVGMLRPPPGATWTRIKNRGRGDVFPMYRIGLKWTDGEEDEADPTLWNILQHLPDDSPRCPGQEMDIEVLFRDEEAPDQGHVLGGRRCPPTIDPALPARWLQQCVRHHGEGCGLVKGHSALMPLFRLLDVHQECMRLVEFKDVDLATLDYAALSYQWGPPSVRQKCILDKANRDALMQRGALHQEMSRTPADAISFTREIGIRYLWVDALCILQDDGEDKGVQIGRMGDIYKCASLTIIAGTGADSDAGLPGHKRPRTLRQEEVTVMTTTGPMRLLTSLELTRASAGTVRHFTADLNWTTRGWTLQEKVLSRRGVIFAEGQIYWTCRRADWREETVYETELAHIYIQAVHAKDVSLYTRGRDLVPNMDPYAVGLRLRNLIEDFGNRNLTFQGDAYDAFSAVLRECEDLLGTRFLWGLPVPNLHEALCWTPALSCLRPLERRLEKKARGEESFPSWSWLGWRGAANMRFNEEDFLGVLIQCHILRTERLELVHASDWSSDNELLHDDRPQRHCDPGEDRVTLEDVYKNIEELTEKRLRELPSGQLLFFWTERAFFKLAGPVLREGLGRSHRMRWAILDEHGNQVGCTAETAYRPAEFILLASNAYDNYFTVLRVKKVDGITYRVDIADIARDAWRAADPKRVLVALG